MIFGAVGGSSHANCHCEVGQSRQPICLLKFASATLGTVQDYYLLQGLSFQMRFQHFSVNSVEWPLPLCRVNYLCCAF